MNKQKNKLLLIIMTTVIQISVSFAQNSPKWVEYQGNEGPGKGKHIVFVSGDEEYRSEEGLPMLAKILAERHGFKCTVLFALDPKTNEINPDLQTNIPGLEHLKTADLMVMLLRFRELPDDQMKYIIDYTNAGKPIVALRTSTHAFSYSRNKQNPNAKYSYNSKIKGWEGGYGKQVFGETWINHHGDHGSESTRGLIAPGAEKNPLLQGVTDVWGPTDVYGIKNLPSDATVLLLGQVIAGMKPTDPPVNGPKNNPMMPLAWTREFKNESGKTNQIFNTTLGAATDLESAGLRRLLVNAVYKMTGLTVPAQADVTPVGEFKPTEFGFNKFIKGVKPEAHALKE